MNEGTLKPRSVYGAADYGKSSSGNTSFLMHRLPVKGCSGAFSKTNFHRGLTVRQKNCCWCRCYSYYCYCCCCLYALGCIKCQTLKTTIQNEYWHALGPKSSLSEQKYCWVTIELTCFFKTHLCQYKVPRWILDPAFKRQKIKTSEVMNIIKTTASIPTKFCTVTKTAKCPSWVSRQTLYKYIHIRVFLDTRTFNKWIILLLQNFVKQSRS